VQRIRKASGTYVHFDPAQDGMDGQTLIIRGPMLKVYRAHALLMRRYHETQHEEVSEPDPPPNFEPNPVDPQLVQDLEEQLAELKRQVEAAKQLNAPARTKKDRVPKGGGKGNQGKGRKGR